MEIIQPKDTEYEYFINRTIMIPERNGLNNFYQVITQTDKMCCIRKIKTETKLCKINYDEITKEESKVYEAKLTEDFENDSVKKIRKTSINKYPVIYCPIVQYEV